MVFPRHRWRSVRLSASLSIFATYVEGLLATCEDAPEARLAHRSIAGVAVVMLCIWRKASGCACKFGVPEARLAQCLIVLRGCDLHIVVEGF